MGDHDGLEAAITIGWNAQLQTEPNDSVLLAQKKLGSFCRFLETDSMRSNLSKHWSHWKRPRASAPPAPAW
jgi:hypothetical protein